MTGDAFIFPDLHRVSLSPSFSNCQQPQPDVICIWNWLNPRDLRFFSRRHQGWHLFLERTSWNEIPFTELNRLSSTFNLLRGDTMRNWDQYVLELPETNFSIRKWRPTWVSIRKFNLFGLIAPEFYINDRIFTNIKLLFSNLSNEISISLLQNFIYIRI